MKKIMIAMMMALVLIPAMARQRAKTSTTKEHLKVFSIPITGGCLDFIKELNKHNFTVMNGIVQTCYGLPNDGYSVMASLKGGSYWDFKDCQLMIGGVEGVDNVSWVLIQPTGRDVYQLPELLKKLSDKYGKYKEQPLRSYEETIRYETYKKHNFKDYYWNLPNGTIDLIIDEYSVLDFNKCWVDNMTGFVLYTDYTHQQLIEKIYQ